MKSRDPQIAGRNGMRDPWSWISLGSRLVLGGLFVTMGWSKATDPVGFLKLVREYHVVDSSILLNAIAIGLPWLEIVCGLLFIAGIASRGTALVSLAMLVPFTTLVLQRALEIQRTTGGPPFCSIRFDCGCGAGEVVICHKLVENVVLIALAVLLLGRPARFMSLRGDLFPRRTARPAAMNPDDLQESL